MTDRVNIEDIMKDIRIELLKKSQVVEHVAGLEQVITSNVLQPDLYDELYQAAIFADIDDASLLVTPTRIPIIGAIWDRFRTRMHEQILEYMQDLAQRLTISNRRFMTVDVVIIRTVEERHQRSEQANDEA